MKAKVDRELCVSCGTCVDVCPEVYELDESDIAIVKINPIPAEHEEACRDGAEQCPTNAIAVEE